MVRTASAIALTLALALPGVVRADDPFVAPLQFTPSAAGAVNAVTDAAGNTTFEWTTSGSGGGPIAVEFRTRLAIGGLLPLHRLVLSPASYDPPAIALDPRGQLMLAWTSYVAGSGRAETRLVGFDGAARPTTRLSAEGVDARNTRLAVDGAGNAVFAWTVGAKGRVQARRRNAAGALGPILDVSVQADEAVLGTPVFNPDGSAEIPWTHAPGAGVDPGTPRVRRLLADGTLEPIEDLAAAASRSAPLVRSGPGARALLAWYAETAPITQAINVRPRLASGGLGPPEPIAGSIPANVVDYDFAVDSAGTATFVWIDEGAVLTRARSAEGALSGAEEAFPHTSPNVVDNTDPRVVLDGTGRALLGWKHCTANCVPLGVEPPPEASLYVRVRAPQAWITPAVRVPPAGHDSGGFALALDGRGAPLAAWSAGSPPQAPFPGVGPVFASGIDAAPPYFSSLDVPARAERGVAIPLSAAVVDDWTQAPVVTFAFGDRTANATGSPIRHAWKKTGRYTVTASARDATGKTTTVPRSVRVTDTRRPRVGRFRVRPRRFRSGAATSFRYRLSEPAAVKLTIARRIGRRWRRVKTLRRPNGSGRERLRFSGHVRGSAIAPGRYRARIVATDPSRNRSRVRGARFKVRP